MPEGVPARRAVLAGTVETAVNAMWDAAPLIGDRVTVVGAGMVGCCVARLLAGIPGAAVQLVDVDAGRATVARALGVDFALPPDAAGGQDLVVHASATSAGLRLSLDLLAREGTVVELSWYGEREVALSLGGWFHSGRLSIRGSQVGTVSPARRSSRTPADRLALALDLLRDPAYDALLSGESPFDDLPAVLAGLADGTLPALTHVITYDHTDHTDDRQRSVTLVQRDGPRPHHGRPQLPRRGVRTRPAPARRDVRGRRHVSPRPSSTPMASWSTSRWPRSSWGPCWAS